MKRVFWLLIGLTLLAGCQKPVEPVVEGFTYSDCTKGDSDPDDPIDLSLLTLRYEGGNLQVTRTDAWLNCSFQNRGLVCTVSVKGSDIYYRVDYEKEGAEVKCVCLVSNLSSVVRGLETGKKYSFHYYCCQNYKPFTITCNEGMITVLDVSTITINQ